MRSVTIAGAHSSTDLSLPVDTAIAYRSGRAVYGTKCLRRLKHWDREFEFQSRHGCLSAYILSVLSYVGSGLATG
jgi:hypothetical protein